MAIRGYVLAKTGWTLDYINELPETHLLFSYHYLKKDDGEAWERLGAHLGTLWDRKTLQALDEKAKGSHLQNDSIFVPLSLVVNPDLPNALLGKEKDAPQGDSTRPAATSKGDGLLTEMAMPEGDEVVNMGDLPREEFMGLVTSAGLANTK